MIHTTSKHQSLAYGRYGSNYVLCMNYLEDEYLALRVQIPKEPNLGVYMFSFPHHRGWGRFILLVENFSIFLAAMSSSRIDVVTQCVRLCVPCFSFSVIEVCSAFSGVSRKLEGCLKSSCVEVLRVFQGGV